MSIEDGLAALLGGDVGISGLRRTSQGFSRENWVFDATWPSGDRSELILRRDPVASVLETDRRVEVAVLRAMAASDVPVPAAAWLDADGARLGRPAVVMERVAGECDWFVLNGERPESERVALAHRLLDLLAAIHRFDWRSAGLGDELVDPGPGTGAATAAIDHWEAELRRQQLEPYPELEVVLGWLRDHRPVAPTTTVVHGDFKPGNVLLRGTEVTAVLDWETAHLGDPVEDLGWITNPLRAREHQIPGVWEQADIVARYQAITGTAVDPAAVLFWQVLANFKLCVIVLTGIRSFVDGRGDRVFDRPKALIDLLFRLISAVPA